MVVQHNITSMNANRQLGIVGTNLAEAITDAFIDTAFSGAQRHERRIRQIETV